MRSLCQHYELSCCHPLQHGNNLRMFQSIVCSNGSNNICYFYFSASRQADLKPGEILLLLEENQNPDQRHGPSSTQAP